MSIQNLQRTDLGSLLERVRQEFSKCCRAIERYRRVEFWFLISGITFGSAATALASVTAVAGSEVANHVGGWRVVCLVVAILSAVATISSAMHKALEIPEHLADSLGCAAQLKSLELDLQTGEVNTQRAIRVYKTIIQRHASILCTETDSTEHRYSEQAALH